MPNCDNCGGWVSHTFARVARIDGEIKRCEHCTPDGRAFDPNERAYRTIPAGASDRAERGEIGR